MSGLTTAVRNAHFTHAVAGGAAPGAAHQVAEWCLVTAVTSGMEAGGAIENECTRTGYSRDANTGIFSTVSDGVGTNTGEISFGTFAAGQGAESYTHVVGVNSSDNCVAIGQITNAARDTAAPYEVDTATNNRDVSFPVSNLRFRIQAVADL